MDGLTHAVMLGVTENYLSPLAVELGHSASNQGLLSTLPILAGALSQLLAPTFTRLIGGRKRFVVACAALQVVTHFWFISIAQHQTRALLPFLAAKVLYFIGGMMLAPAWSAWMASLTVGPGRERYFALRTGGIQAVLLLAFAYGAFGLERTEQGHVVLGTYVELFWVGLAARTLSCLLLSSQHDPDPLPPAKRLRIAETLERGDFRVPMYLGMLHFGASIASPFFIPWWLHELKLGYHRYAILIGTAVLAKAASIPNLHRVAARYGMLRLLYGAGLGVACLPLLWAAAGSFSAFVVLQVASGMLWGALEYAGFQLLLGGSDDDTRLEYLSIAGTLAGLGQVSGALLGSALLDRVHLSYPTVFCISGAVRGLPLLLSFLLARGARVRQLVSGGRQKLP